MFVHLVDGTFELFRAYYGGPSIRSPKGKEVGATRVFLRSLYRLTQEKKTTHIAVAFDHVIESFRNKLFSGYKTGEGIDPDLYSQFPLVEQASRALGIVTWPMVKFEADDALATAAVKFSKTASVKQVIICSPDKDLCQVVNRNKIVTFDRIRQSTLNESGVKKKFGVLPSSIPDWLGLVGDSADGIPGLPRWGAKSTSQVLAKFKFVEKIPNDFGSWKLKVRGGEKLSEILNANRKEATLFKKLATLRTDVPLKEKLIDLKWKAVNHKKLEKLCLEIGDNRFMKSIA